MWRPLIVAAFTLLLSSGREDARPPPKPKSPQQKPQPRCFHLKDGAADLAIGWSKVQATGGCFFFSGPRGLGRDDPLGSAASWNERGGSAVLRFESLEFSGTLADRTTSLERHSTHEYQRDRWRVDETIEGVWVTDSEGCDIFEGTYTYSECNTADAADCPSRCTINAQLSARAE